jgi:hypothetical protein
MPQKSPGALFIKNAIAHPARAVDYSDKKIDTHEKYEGFFSSAYHRTDTKPGQT